MIAKMAKVHYLKLETLSPIVSEWRKIPPNGNYNFSHFCWDNFSTCWKVEQCYDYFRDQAFFVNIDDFRKAWTNAIDFISTKFENIVI